MWRCTRTEEVHCLRIGCSAPTYKNKRGTGTPNHSPPHPFMRSWALLVAGRARRPRHHLHPGPLRHLPHLYMRRARKRCNSNDMNSKFELIAGELRAKLLIDIHNWATCSTPVRTGGPGCGARGRWQGLAGQRADAPSKARGADGSRAGRRPRAHQAARHTAGRAQGWARRPRAHQAARPSRPGPRLGPLPTGTQRGPKPEQRREARPTKSSPSGPCARGDASRPCRSGCEPRCAAPPPRRR